MISDHSILLYFDPRLRTVSGPMCPPSAAGISAPRATASTASGSAASSGENREKRIISLGGATVEALVNQCREILKIL